MAITEVEFNKERKILNKTSKLVLETIDDLGVTVIDGENNFQEFQKMMWNESSSFDSGELNQVAAASNQEAQKQLAKVEYFKKLLQIKDKPYFASIVFKDDENTTHNIYISLTYLKDDNYNNILYDWRSPICSLFYDYETGPCQYVAPGGIYKGDLKRKRQYKIEKNTLLGVFDNSLNIDDEVLQTVLANDSNEKMKNVVNTIQQEQNKVIRNLEDKVLIVQGIAGSGKTTVALHRIAFLLYRLENLSSKNVLIFSPNNIFSEYISDVLPSLGEQNTLQTTFNDYILSWLPGYNQIETFSNFVSKYYQNEIDNHEIIEYKQSDQLITELNLYLDNYLKNVGFISGFVENKKNIVSKEELNEMLNYKYNRLPLYERINEMAKRLSSNFYKGSMKKQLVFLKLIKENANFKKDYQELFNDFFKSKYCSLNITETEVNNFLKGKTLSYEDSLILAYIKGNIEGFKYENNIKQVIIDEAQDYNKLQYIIISKIFKKAEFTILGDINQNINPYYRYNSLSELAQILDKESKYIELLKTYRSSPEIINYSNKILNLNHVNAIRKSNEKPVIFRKDIDDLKNSLLQDINKLKDNYKSLAIITKNYKEANYIHNLIKEDINISLVDGTNTLFEKDLIIIPAFISKGLEFDSVIIYNDRSNSYKTNERNLLYVACTRAQHELIVYN